MKKIIAIACALLAFIYGCLLWDTAQPFAGRRPVSLGARADAARLEQTVRSLVGDFPHRHGANSSELGAAGEWIERRLFELGLKPSRQSFTVQGQSYFNVLVDLGKPSGPMLVVGAHYDAHADTPGADDNASGVAALLEIARLLGDHAPECPIQLAFWTLEEPPYFRSQKMGSAQHVNRLRERKADIRFALSLEMVGYFSDEPGSQHYPPGFPFQLAYPSEGNFILLLGDSGSADSTRLLKAAFAGSSDVPLRSANVPRTMAGADFSDHLNFWQAGYRAFMLTDTAFLRNASYHHKSDSPDRLDYRRMAGVVDGVAAMLLDGCSHDYAE